MNLFENDSTIKEVALFDAVKKTEEHKIFLPPYQRDAIWSEGRMCALWDSLLRGFPLPLFLLVNGSGESHPLPKNQEPRAQSEKIEGEYFDLLDGQQRLTAIIRGVSAGGNPVVRLWVDFAPPTPDEKKLHPFEFKYWLHPCTNVFPFGFRMEASGEHDFAALHDEELAKIWEALQGQSDHAGKDFYAIPLKDSFPWRARCPVPLDELIDLVRHDDTLVDSTVLALEVKKLAEKHREKIAQYNADWIKPPQENVVESVVSALLRLKKTKLVFQVIDLDSVDDGYTLFKRIGRGGVPITQRQLAVSKLMLILGRPGNDAVAGFHKTRWGYMLETEDIIHALARIAYVFAEVKPLPTDGSPDFENKSRDWDMFDLSTEKLKTMKKDEESWSAFKYELEKLSEASRLKNVFNNVFEKILLYHPLSNPHGFSLVQLAQGSLSGEGIAPVTLHPLLLWQFKYGDDQSLEKSASEDMLRWVLFSNGMTTDPRNGALNHTAFREVFSRGRLDFSPFKEKVFLNKQLCRDIGIFYNKPKVNQDGKIDSTDVLPLDLLSPKEHVELTARRLLLQNWAMPPSVSKFVLMWNQRDALEKLYGNIPNEYLPALHGKGRPFDLDHIIARKSFLRSESDISGIDQHSLLNGTRSFFVQNDVLKNPELKEENFRKYLANANANYRYWPKHLNRADGKNNVKTKMKLQGVLKNLENHPLFKKFEDANQETVWKWSAVPIQFQQDWERLPPDKGEWNSDLIALFIRTLLRRQYQLYGTAYQFLTSASKALDDNFNPDGIICTD